MVKDKPVLLLLVITVFAPIVLYTDKLARYTVNTPLTNGGFLGDASSQDVIVEEGKLDVLRKEFASSIRDPTRRGYSGNAGDGAKDPPGSSDLPVHSSGKISAAGEQEAATGASSGEHKTRVLSEADEIDRSGKGNVIHQVTEMDRSDDHAEVVRNTTSNPENKEENKKEENKKEESTGVGNVNRKIPRFDQISTSQKQSEEHHEQKPEEHVDRNAKTNPLPDAKVRQLRDQLIRGKVYLSLGSTRSNAHFTRELRLRMKDVHRVVADASKDSELPRNADEKLRAMEHILEKGKRIQDDCSDVIKKLRAILHSTEEQLKVHKKQTLFLTQLAAKTLPKGLHCLPLRLSTDYYSLNRNLQELPNKEKFEDPELHHFAIFSDNVLAAAVVVNSSVVNAKHPSNYVFHIVTDKLNYAAMRMWFLVNPPGKATVDVQNIDDFTWLNASYSPVLKQLQSPSMIDYYFRTHKANSDPNMKYRNPKYLSILNHLRFYLPEIFPKLNKVVFLDDDIVVQKDLAGLWDIDLGGNVNGAVETCGENFHRFDRYLNFSNPLISKNFNPHACGWAYGMNVFDLKEWKKQNITEVYHSWQKLNQDRLLWKLGTLPPGLITFYNRTLALDRFWHVLGLGYNPGVNRRDIERAAVIHYNGNQKPWLEIGIQKYRNYWVDYLNYDQPYLRGCNINP